MLTEAEDGLIAHVKAAAIGAKLAVVGSLPDLDGDSLVKRFSTDAPAVYVVPASFPVSDGSAALKFGLACVARNNRGHDAARKGDGVAIGLYQILEGVAALFDNGSAGGVVWRVTGVDFMADEKLYQAGIYVAVVRIETVCTMPPALDEAALADFATLRSDYDVPPFAAAGEHEKWAGDPPDQTTSKPELSDQQNLQP